MPKRLKKLRRPPSDPNQAAHRLTAEIATDSEVAPDFEEQLSAYMARLGAKGGKVGGARRMATMTPQERSAVALKAARARWRKAKTKGKV